jgi:hypothetical protein
MRLRRRTKLALAAMLVLAACALTASAGTAGAAGGGTRLIPSSGTGTPQTGDFTPSGANDATQAEFAGESGDGEGPDPYSGNIIDRSLSTSHGNGASVNSGKKAKSNPVFNLGFEGLNHYQQRYSRGGNQFSVEPPDQGMCAGNGYVVEAVNDVLNVFDASTGASALPDNTATNIVGGFARNVNHAVDLNSFFGYAPAINRATGGRGPFVTDPSCLYDAQTQRWFVVVLTLEVKPTAPSAGGFLGPNHLDIAVSNTPNPTGAWTIYRLPVQDDGTDGTPNHHCTHTGTPPVYRTNPNACLGDYPHIGADANGFYITTNEYEFFGNAFIGAQIYAFSKTQLASTPASISVTQFDTSTMGAGGKPGFTLWPAQSPAGQFATGNGGTEYFLSSDAADEAQCDSGTVCSGTGSSTDLLVWALTNTSSLNSSPALSLGNKVLTVNQYAIPPKQQQPGSGTLADKTTTPDVAQGACINDTTTPTIFGTGCWNLLFICPPATPDCIPHNEVISRPDSNDTRMQQVMYANGKLWGALDTALNPDGGPPRAGIAWYIVNPNAGNIVKQGYLGAAGHDFTYPAIGVTSSGRGVMAFTATGDTLNPSAAYAPIDANAGVGTWDVVAGGTGAARDDGFTSYKSQVGNPPRTRWGDYGAAAVDGNSVWIASEYIAHACDYTPWGGPFFVGGSGDNLLGTCGGASHGPGGRTALANWSTRISKFTP